jgi:hypothetical protein
MITGIAVVKIITKIIFFSSKGSGAFVYIINEFN